MTRPWSNSNSQSPLLLPEKKSYRKFGKIVGVQFRYALYSLMPCFISILASDIQ